MIDDRSERLPLPSEDEGDLVEEPREGMTDDPLVASEEGVPYDPPTDRVLSEARVEVAGPDESDAGELERDDSIQAEDRGLPRDDELQADVVEALRASDVPSGDRIRVAAAGSTVIVSGEVESMEVLDEILGIVGDVRGVDEVVDQLTVPGV